MGSTSKKHKSEKRSKRSHSPERERERRKHHKRHKSHKHRHEEVEVISSSGSDVEEVAVLVPPQRRELSPTPPPPPPPVISREVLNDGKSHDSLSIEATNALRAKLGLKPLQIESRPSTSAEGSQKYKREAEDGTDMGEFVHKPAENISQKKRSEKLKQRIEDRKDKRRIEDKLKSVKGLGESDGEDDAKDWVKKSREKEKQKREADKRAKLLDELDSDFGISALVEEERKATRSSLYSGRDLKGLKVGHALDGFDEGKNVILTLKDSGVLDEDGDTLVNVNMIDNERYKKNVERRTKKKSLLFDDMEEIDAKKDVLSKYDEEIDGEKEDSFAIGEEMSAAEKARQRMDVKRKLLHKTKVDLNSELRPATDYYTEEEVSTIFRKPKKLRKIRKRPKVLKAEDLVPVEETYSQGLFTRRDPDADVLDYDDMDVVKTEDPAELGIEPMQDEDLANVKIEPDEAELELQLALNKARLLKQKEVMENQVEKIAKEIIKNEQSSGQDTGGGSIVLNSTAEFCRTLGDIPTYGLSGNREEEEDLLDFEREMKEEALRREEERRNRGAWSQVDLDDPKSEIMPTDVAILDEEPDIKNGVAGALRLAISKGYLEKETANRPSASRFAHLQAQNYSIEDKSHVEDEKFGRRERFMGPASDFKEKAHYKPNVKLDYIDDDGRILNPKEAFRYLSHKFHGKGPGKNKVEKRMKKNEQEALMKQMSSSDTPLRTLTMLQNKQKETQSPFVILSGKAQATISKSK